MKTHNWPIDAETLSANALKDEGAFLHAAGRASDALARRLSSAHSSVRCFRFSRDELEQLSGQFTRAVAIGVEYHLDAAEPPA